LARDSEEPTSGQDYARSDHRAHEIYPNSPEQVDSDTD
jgi:hypothetical protein